MSTFHGFLFSLYFGEEGSIAKDLVNKQKKKNVVFCMKFNLKYSSLVQKVSIIG